MARTKQTARTSVLDARDESVRDPRNWRPGGKFHGSLRVVDDHSESDDDEPLTKRLKRAHGVVALDGGSFAGEVVHGQAHGHGTWIGADGSRYDGQFVAGERCGVGVHNTDAYEYRGQWQGGEREGHGRLVTDDEEHVGVWRHDALRVGTSWTPGAEYVGEFEDGAFHGHGVYTELGGRSEYRGEWKAGQRDGYGTMRRNDVGTYAGGWRGGSEHGTGTLVVGELRCSLRDGRETARRPADADAVRKRVRRSVQAADDVVASVVNDAAASEMASVLSETRAAQRAAVAAARIAHETDALDALPPQPTDALDAPSDEESLDEPPTRRSCSSLWPVADDSDDEEPRTPFGAPLDSLVDSEPGTPVGAPHHSYFGSDEEPDDEEPRTPFGVPLNSLVSEEPNTDEEPGTPYSIVD